MQSLSQRVCSIDPRLLNAEATVGELAWCWGKDYDTLCSFWKPRLWEEKGDVVAWAWLQLPYNIDRPDGKMRSSKQARLVWQTAPERIDLVQETFNWFVEAAGQVELAMILLTSDLAARQLAQDRGFEFDVQDAAEDGDWTQLNLRSLDDVEAPSLPDGYCFTSANQIPREERVAIHQAAWGSPLFTTASLARLETTWPYRKDLHVFVQAANGTLAASAIIWFDEGTWTAEFEPVGTHPDFRRKGLGRALQLYGMQRVKELGGSKMLVACLGGSTHPAAKNLYQDVGFREISRDYPMIKRIDS